GPDRVLGHHRRNPDGDLRAAPQPRVELHPAGRRRGRAGDTDPLLRHARDRLPADRRHPDGRPLLEDPEGRRHLGPRVEKRAEPMTIEKRSTAPADKNAPPQAPRVPAVERGGGPKLPGPPGVPGTERFRLLAYV